MRLESNGRKSCGKGARHVEMRCFYIKDFTDKGLTQIKNCPTKKMLADFFTKPLQGNLFRCFKDFILVHRPISELKLLISRHQRSMLEWLGDSQEIQMWDLSIHNWFWLKKKI